MQTSDPRNASAPQGTPQAPSDAQPEAAAIAVTAAKAAETGGPAGPEPTRYGDWERKGRCIDF